MNTKSLGWWFFVQFSLSNCIGVCTYDRRTSSKCKENSVPAHTMYVHMKQTFIVETYLRVWDFTYYILDRQFLLLVVMYTNHVNI